MGEVPLYSSWHAWSSGLHLICTLVTGPRRSLSPKLRDTRVYEPEIRAHLGNHSTPTQVCENEIASSCSFYSVFMGASIGYQRDLCSIAEQPAPAPHVAHPEGCAATRIVPVTVPRCQPLLRAADSGNHPFSITQESHYTGVHGP